MKLDWKHVGIGLAQEAVPWLIAQALDKGPEMLAKNRKVIVKSAKRHPIRLAGAVALGLGVIAAGVVLTRVLRAHQAESDAHS